jgi:SOS-response transcriptional repressor LexA
VDLPSIDTIMMLRPTESKILFLQQLGRGLRCAENKDRLVVLDFIGNHKAFLNKPQALFKAGMSHGALAEFARKAEAKQLALPAGCFVNYDPRLIDFLRQLDAGGAQKEYQALRDSLGRRPTPTEFFHSGADMLKMRKQSGSWWQFVERQGDLTTEENECLANFQAFFKEVETTAMTKCFKMVLLESLLESDGFANPPTLSELSEQALKVFSRRRPLIADIKAGLRDIENLKSGDWETYWRANPINAWLGNNRKSNAAPWFRHESDRFITALKLNSAMLPVFSQMLQELVDYRLAAYLPRLDSAPESAQILPFVRSEKNKIELPYFPDIKIACGHFKTGTADAVEYREISISHGKLDPPRHFIARATGDSMNGGKSPIHDGDYLLLERVTPTSAGSITNNIMAIERQDETGDNQYLLRMVTKDNEGRYLLKATNPAFPDYEADENMRTFARFKEVIRPVEIEG